MSEAEWKSRAAFAEIAEAVGVPTDRIMTVRWRNAELGEGIVLWSDEQDDIAPADMVVRGAMLKRGADGVLTLASVPSEVGTLGEMMPDLFGRQEP